MNTQFLMTILLLALVSAKEKTLYPVAIFHGMTQICNGPGRTVKPVIQTITAEMAPALVKCIEVGKRPRLYSVIHNVKEQAEDLCPILMADPVLGGNNIINIVGISQGSHIGFYITQYCKPRGTVRNLYSLGGAHSGL